VNRQAGYQNNKKAQVQHVSAAKSKNEIPNSEMPLLFDQEQISTKNPYLSKRCINYG